MPNERHVPIRTCILCGEKLPKSELLRIVRHDDGSVVIDDRVRLKGRGCYVCLKDTEIDLNEIRGKIKRALKFEANVSDEFLELLKAQLDPK